MDLTWKDKFSFYVTEFRQKLPFSDQPKKQLLVFGGGVGGIIVFLFATTLVSVTYPDIISSSSLHLTPKGNTIPSNSDTSQQAKGQNTAPQSSGQSQATSGNGTNSSHQGSSASSTIQTGESQVVLQSKPFTVTKNSSGTASSTGGSSSASGGSNNAPTPGGAVIGTTDLSNIPLLFQPGSGTPVQNGITPTPPADLTWLIYYNARENYSIAYPVGWQAVKAIYNNHEGVALYPPENISQGQSEEIGFGISQFSYGMPGVTTGDATSIADILVDGYPGKLYTQGSLQSNTVAAVFKYGDFYFGLGGTADNATMIYVFTHMLSSLQLYGGSF